MAHDIFLSHSRHDKLTADAVCNRLESAGIRCWIAPRDVAPGTDWTESILQAIGSCRVMVLVFSDHTNDSRHVRIEVAHAFKHELTIIPFRIHAAVPKGSLEYYLDAVHWLDALTQPLEQHLEALTVRLKSLMSLGEAGPFTHPFHAEESAPTDAAGRFAVSETLRREGEQQANKRLEAQAREREEKERLEAERRATEAKERLNAEQLEKERVEAKQRDEERLEAELRARPKARRRVREEREQLEHEPEFRISPQNRSKAVPSNLPKTNQTDRSLLVRAVIASTVGTSIEWYDFFLYSTVTGLVFAKEFFPNSDPFVGLCQPF
jgi:hypothetical protein